MYNVIGKGILELQNDMDSGKVSACELVCAYLERIAKLDHDGPMLNSVVEINVEAIETARALDRERKLVGKRSNLHGIPILIKDNIETKGQLHTRAGTRALAGYFANKDATIVRRLRDAGAIILGKTNLSEMAKYFSTTIRNGYSSYGGQVVNPYNATADAGGSSTGSAVAVAATLCAAAIGSETCQSIIFPASCNSVVGIKPTIGMVSRNGIIPLAYSQDTAGPIARSVEDAAIVLGVIAGEDPEDITTLNWNDVRKTDYTECLTHMKLDKTVVGINIAEISNFSDEERILFENAVKVMTQSGINVKDVSIPNMHCDRRLLAYEFKKNFEYWLSNQKGNIEIKSLQDFITYNNYNKDLCLKYGQNRLEESEFTSGNLTEPEYIFDKMNCLKKRYELDEIMKRQQIDVIMSPGCTDIPAITNNPAICVPAGYCSDNTPFGVTFYSSEGCEEIVLRVAYEFENIVRIRKEPEYD